MRDFSRRLRLARKQAGYATAKITADEHKWPVSTYRAHENGQNLPSLGMLLNYAKAFDCGVEWLATGRPLPAFVPFCQLVGNGTNGGFIMFRKTDVSSIRIPFPVEINAKLAAFRCIENIQRPFIPAGSLVIVENRLKPVKVMMGSWAIIKLSDKLVFDQITEQTPPDLKAYRWVLTSTQT